MITAVELPAQGFAKKLHLSQNPRPILLPRSRLISVAVGIELEGNTIKEARFALGGVAHKPWRNKAAEDVLRGQAANADNFKRAADVFFA